MIFSRRFYANENPSRFHCQESTLYPEHNNPSSYAGLSLHESSTKVQVEQTPMFKNGQTFYLPYKCAINILEFIPFTTYLSAAVDMLFISSAANTALRLFPPITSIGFARKRECGVGFG